MLISVATAKYSCIAAAMPLVAALNSNNANNRNRLRRPSA
jgi:hypothetical protein